MNIVNKDKFRLFKKVLILSGALKIFEAKYGFQSNLSILDLLFHEGPESLNYLTKLINH